jgi:hypothetical protein
MVSFPTHLSLILLAFPHESAQQWLEWSSPRSGPSANLEFSGSIRGFQEDFVCYGGTKESTAFQINVQDGVPPWRVTVLRDESLYARIKIEKQGMFGAFRPQSASYVFNTTLSGKYRLDRLCDSHFCNGTITSAPLSVVVKEVPTAIIRPCCLEICLNNSDIKPKIRLNGSPPFSATFSPMDLPHMQRLQASVVRKYSRDGLHDVPFLSRTGFIILKASFSQPSELPLRFKSAPHKASPNCSHCTSSLYSIHRARPCLSQPCGRAMGRYVPTGCLRLRTGGPDRPPSPVLHCGSPCAAHRPPALAPRGPLPQRLRHYGSGPREWQSAMERYRQHARRRYRPP